MDIFVEYLDGDFAVCRLPDKAKNLIRLPLRDLPDGVRELVVISMRDNGSFVINDYAREVRMKKISQYLRYKKYCFDFQNN
ncbi:MAG: hypothetical protein IKT55_07570 [Clostridia bacterium]|jgi:hypothetical protein|nr:hypothetical protein [Clostridia bacterium]